MGKYNKLPKWVTKDSPQLKGYTQASQDGFYNSKEWKQLSQLHKYMNPLCVECEKLNKYKSVEVTDHIKSVKEFPELALEYDNLQSLCYYHHRLKTRRDNSRYNQYKLDKGRELKESFYKK